MLKVANGTHKLIVEENIIDSCGGFYVESIADLKEQLAWNLGDEFFELIDALE